MWAQMLWDRVGMGTNYVGMGTSFEVRGGCGVELLSPCHSRLLHSLHISAVNVKQ